MCLNPISIPNPSRRFLKGVSAPMIKVPCRHCSECESAAQDAWFVRAHQEYVRCKKSGGDVWFPTLTFNDEHLPIWRDPEHNFECQCCDVDLIKRFRDQFRVNLGRKVNPSTGLPFDTKSIRFEFVTEYGEELGRLHHHALIFVPFKVPESIMVDCIERAWSYRLEPVKIPLTVSRGKNKGKIYYRYFRDPETGKTSYYKVPKNGFVMWSNDGKTINSASGIRYVQKYITKPQQWIKDYGIYEYEERLKADIREWCNYKRYYNTFTEAVRHEARSRCAQVGEYFRISPDFSEAFPHHQPYSKKWSDDDCLDACIDFACDLLRRWRRACPRHLQSTYFGIDGINYYVDQETGEFIEDKLIDGHINLGDRQLFGDYAFMDSKHPDFVYNMPQYYANKIFKTKDDYGLYVNNEVFDKCFEARFERSQHLLALSYAPYFQPDWLREHLSPLGLPQSEIDNVSRNFAFLMGDRPVERLALYETVYQGRDLKRGLEFFRDFITAPAGFSNPAFDDVEPLYHCAVDYLYYQKHLELIAEPAPERFRNRSNFQGNVDTFGDHPFFRDFDYILDTIHDYEHRLNELVDDANRLKAERRAKILKQKKSRSLSKISKHLYVQRKIQENYGK